MDGIEMISLASGRERFSIKGGTKKWKQKRRQKQEVNAVLDGLNSKSKGDFGPSCCLQKLNDDAFNVLTLVLIQGKEERGR